MARWGKYEIRAALGVLFERAADVTLREGHTAGFRLLGHNNPVALRMVESEIKFRSLLKAPAWNPPLTSEGADLMIEWVLELARNLEREHPLSVDAERLDDWQFQCATGQVVGI